MRRLDWEELRIGGETVNSLAHERANSIWTTLQQSAVFWDVNGATLHRVLHADWIIDRVLPFGQWEDWMAVFSHCSEQQIQDALHHQRVPNHILEFWQAYFNVDVNAETRRRYQRNDGGDGERDFAFGIWAGISDFDLPRS